MPHVGATEKTVEGGLGLGSLTLSTTASADGLGLQIFVFPHNFDQFLVHHVYLLRKADVGCHERLDCGSIFCGGSSKVGDGFHSLLFNLLVGVLHGGIVNGMVARALGNLLQFAHFLVGNGEICFKFDQVLLAGSRRRHILHLSKSMLVLKTRL